MQVYTSFRRWDVFTQVYYYDRLKHLFGSGIRSTTPQLRRELAQISWAPKTDSSNILSKFKLPLDVI